MLKPPKATISADAACVVEKYLKHMYHPNPEFPTC
jgi:hypothetical protein